MMRSETELSEFSVAPLLGAAGAAVAFSVAAERFAIKRQTAALGCAAVAFGLSQATSGAARALFQGAALAGIGLAIVELVRTLRQDRPAATPNSRPMRLHGQSYRQPSPPPSRNMLPPQTASSPS